MTLSYRSGPAIPEFLPIGQSQNIPLPARFDDRCKQCKKPMERMRVSLCTTRKPYAQFHCTKCALDLYIFEAPRIPFIVWSDTLQGVLQFSKYIAEKIEERERDRKRDLEREEAAAKLDAAAV